MYPTFVIGDILKRSVSEWARRLVLFIVGSAVLCVPFIALEVAIAEAMLPDTWLVLGGSLALYSLGMLMTAMVTHSVVYRISGLVEIITKSATNAMLRLPHAVATAVLVTWVTTLGFLPFVLGTFFATQIASFLLSFGGLGALASFGLAGLVPLLGLFVSLVLVIRLNIKYAVAVPAVVMEDIGPWAALGRSKDLTDDKKAQIFVIYLVVALISLIGSAILGAGVDTARGVAYSIKTFSGSGMAGGIATWVLMVVVMTWYATLSAVIYDALSDAENY
jgi:hypothetical protein